MHTGSIPMQIDPDTGNCMALAEDNCGWYKVDPEACGLAVPQYTPEQEALHEWIREKNVSSV